MSAADHGRLRIVFVAPEEPSVMPIFFEKVIPRLRDEIVAMAIVSPIYRRSSWIEQAKRFTAAFGVRAFAVEAVSFFGYKVRDALPAGRHYSLKRIARGHGLRVLTPESVNGADFLAELSGLEPDLVISVSCPQLFGRELLDLPRLGCVNVHSALLPEYRGMLPTFWVLARGEKCTGVTVHFMTPGIDGGDIICQRRIGISSEETLRSLMRECKRVAADLVLEAISRFRDGSVSTLPNPADAGSYYSFPGREDVRRFKAMGRALR